MNTRVYFYLEKIFHRLESDSKETTFNRTISRYQRLQTKTPEKEHVNMASQAECQANVLIFTLIFRCSA